MPNYSQQELLDLFDALPGDLKRAVVSENTANVNNNLAEKYSLNKRSLGLLAGMVGNILMGLLSPLELFNSIQNELGLNAEDSTMLINDLMAQIFYPLKDKILPFYPDTQFSPERKIVRRGYQAPQPEAAVPPVETAAGNDGQPATAPPAQPADDSYRESM